MREKSTNKKRYARQSKKALKNYNNFRFLIYSLLVATMLITISVCFTFAVSAADNKKPEPANKYYTSITVKAEQTLWDIADEYSTKDNNSYICEIKKINNMNSDTIYAGQNLIVYYYGE